LHYSTLLNINYKYTINCCLVYDIYRSTFSKKYFVLKYKVKNIVEFKEEKMNISPK